MVEERMIASFDGTKLYTKKEVPENPKAIAIIVHGLCEHQGRYDHVAAALNARNIGTYRWDHRGHGLSEGERSFFNTFTEPLDDLNTIVDLAIAENPGKKIFLIGHSMGGFTVSHYGARYPDKKEIAGVVTSGALTHNTKARGFYTPEGMDIHSTIPNELGTGTCSVQAVVDAYENDPLTVKTISAGLRYALRDGVFWYREHVKDFKYPVLMMHGEMDPLIWVEDSLLWFKDVGSTDKQLKIWGGCYHEIFNEFCKEQVIADTITWIEARI